MNKRKVKSLPPFSYINNKSTFDENAGSYIYDIQMIHKQILKRKITSTTISYVTPE